LFVASKVQFNGTVTKTFDKRCIFTKQLYSCVKCSNEFSLDIDFSYVDFFLKPEKCPCSEDCKSDKFNQVEMESKRKKINFFIHLIKNNYFLFK
jgi:DNA replicative helicase MCM subunit Mcm2 (Cdc46/Mcm family)